jgi:hypothetical protein
MTLPQEMALSLAHLLYMARGVLVKYLYRIRKMMKPTTWDNTLEATVRP